MKNPATWGGEFTRLKSDYLIRGQMIDELARTSGTSVDGSFYAIKTTIGNLGPFAGISTDGHARVLDDSGRPVEGPFAVGNDSASLMGGNYPGWHNARPRYDFWLHRRRVPRHSKTVIL